MLNELDYTTAFIPLVGAKLQYITRSIDLVGFGFGELRQITDRRGHKKH